MINHSRKQEAHVHVLCLFYFNYIPHIHIEIFIYKFYLNNFSLKKKYFLGKMVADLTDIRALY